MNKSKNDRAWEGVFKKYSILEEIATKGRAVITSNDLNEFREARLMTKFDHRSQLPKLFADHQLSILPISRGSYVISTFETFRDFGGEETEMVKIKFPTFLESIDYKEIASEATAINCAYVSNILQDFSGEESLFPTVSGGMGSRAFAFNINSFIGTQKVVVENSQIEIDGGYEGDRSLNLIEAKNYIASDFMIRQLYYPYRLWLDRVNKIVRPIYLTYSNGVFHLREYAFTDPNQYNSLQLVKERRYIIEDAVLNIELVEILLDKTRTVKEPEIPFPQANSFERVINLCELLKQRNILTKEEITTNYDFDSRQTDYYSNAGRYLGLVETKTVNKQPICFLTKKGENLFNLTIAERQIEFVKMIIAHQAFKNVLKLSFSGGNVPSSEKIVEIMKESNLYQVDSQTTYFRRASTITGWINWILNQMEE